MKKIILISIMAMVGVTAFLYFNKNTQSLSASSPTKKIRQALPLLLRTNSVIAPPSSSNLASSSTVIEPTNEVINALTATNLEQWKRAVKDLKQLGGFKYQQYWTMEQDNPDGSPNRNAGKSFMFSQNNHEVHYEATFINITAKNETGDLIEVEMQTPNMNIDETRELGLQLCNMLQVDPKDFLAWCDKVGNRWMDQPLFGDGNRYYSFHLLQTFNNEKPWCINFMITPNP